MRPPLAVVSDLDGTLLPRPEGMGSTLKTRSLAEGPAFEPLVKLLELGGTVVGVTGSGFESHSKRFFADFPLAARKGGRVLLAVETGRRLYRGSPIDGNPIEDEAYTSFFESRIRPLAQTTVDDLISLGRAGLAQFYRDLGTPSETDRLVPPNDSMAFLRSLPGTPDCEEAPLTTDVKRVPRIEIREGNAAVVFVGVPVRHGNAYFSIPPRLGHLVDGKATGRSCFDCLPAGLSKSLVLDFLLEAGEITPGRVVAFGDQPAGNDEGLTRWHPKEGGDGDGGEEGVIPFVSVSERREMVPDHLQAWHCLSGGGNAASAARALSMLVESEGKQQAEHGGVEYNLATMEELVRRANEE